jgi:hypothetical protein
MIGVDTAAARVAERLPGDFAGSLAVLLPPWQCGTTISLVCSHLPSATPDACAEGGLARSASCLFLSSAWLH